MEITLALGGGGARGYAHLGVVHVLQKTSFHIRGIAGSSAGALVGALVAAGYDEQTIQQEFDALELSRIFQRRSGDTPSILGLAGMETLLKKLLGERRFDELEMPFAATAVDLKTGKSVFLQNGSVRDAVMASIALPGFFPPREIDGSLYIDGSTLLPVPVPLARQLAPGLPVVAVTLSTTLEEWGETCQQSSFFMALPVLDRFLERSRVAQSINILLTAVDIGCMHISELCLERDQPEVILRPKVYNVGLLERVKGDALVTAGEDATFAALDQIFWAVSWRGKLVRKYPWLGKFLGKKRT